jgi:hypothetical protein
VNEQLIDELFVEAQRCMTGSTSKEFSQKFAELLILECIELVETTPRHCAFTTYDLGTVECTIQKASERLHEYYGIQRVFKTTDERTSTKEIPNARRSL